MLKSVPKNQKAAGDLCKGADYTIHMPTADCLTQSLKLLGPAISKHKLLYKMTAGLIRYGIQFASMFLSSLIEYAGSNVHLLQVFATLHYSSNQNAAQSEFENE